jgi:hypothetical protein
VLYGVLLFYARQDGQCFPALAALCQDLGMGETSIRQYLHELTAAGLITQRRRGQGRTNRYILHGPVPNASMTPAITPEPELPVAAPCTGSAPANPVDAAGQEARTGAADEERDDSDRRFVASNLRMVPPEPAKATDRIMAASAPLVLGTGQRDTDSHRTKPDERAAVTQSEMDRPHDDLRYQALLRPLTALTAEFDDMAPVRSNVTRAYRLLVRSGLPCDEFLQCIAEARAITLARRERITKRCVGADSVMHTNMMPYWFSVLTSLVQRRPAQQPVDVPAITGALRLQEHPLISYSEEPSTDDAELPTEISAQAERHDTTTKTHPSHRYSTQDNLDHRALWQRVLAELRRMLVPAAYARCLAGVVGSEHGAVLQIEAPDPMHLCWFETRLRRVIDAALVDLDQVGLRVAFNLAQSGTDSGVL